MRMSDFEPEEILEWMSAHFDINADSGSIIWVAPPTNLPRLRGRDAGYGREEVKNKVYVYIKRNGVYFKRSWLIFLWSCGRWPRHCIDHINGNSEDDRISNLREASHTQNMWNRRKVEKKSHFPMGIRKRSSGHYEARITCRGESHHLGTFGTLESAKNAHMLKRNELFGEFSPTGMGMLETPTRTILDGG